MVTILVVSSVSLCLGVLLASVLFVSGRASREEERRAIDSRNKDVYGSNNAAVNESERGQ